MKAIIKVFLLLIFLIPINVVASDKIDNNQFEVQISTSSPTRNITSFPMLLPYLEPYDRTMRFDVKVKHPSYNLLGVDLDKSVVNGIYQKERYAGGKFIKTDSDINILDKFSLKKIFSKHSFERGYMNEIDNSFNMHYYNSEIRIEDVSKYDVDMTIYVKTPHINISQTEKSKVFENVIIARDYSLVEAPPVEISSIEISLMLKAASAETVFDNKKFYNYQVITKTRDKLCSKISIIEGDKEIFLDSRIFGGGLKIGKMDDNGNIEESGQNIVVPEVYFNKPLKIKVYYHNLWNTLLKSFLLKSLKNSKQK